MVITTTSCSSDLTTLNATTLNATTQRVMTSDVVRPEDEAATPEEAVVEDAVPTTQHATLQPSVYCGGPYSHEGGRSKCPAYNAECHQCGIVGHYAHKCRGGAPPSRMENSNRGRGRSNSREIAVEDDATYITWSMETNSRLKRRCRSKLQPRAINAKTYTP